MIYLIIVLFRLSLLLMYYNLEYIFGLLFLNKGK